MSWLSEKSLWLFLIPVADGLIGRNAPNPSVYAAKVIDRVPLLEVLDHLLVVLVTMEFGGVVLDQAVGAFHHSIGLGLTCSPKSMPE